MTEERAHSALFGVLSRDLLTERLGFRFQARGNSMAPSIDDGDILHVEPVAGDKLRKGHVVLFSDGAHFRAHRIVEVREGAVVTQGDTVAERDGAVRLDQILGKVVAREKRVAGVTHLAKLGSAPHRNWMRLLRVGRVAARVVSRVGAWRSNAEKRRFTPGVSRRGLLILLFALVFTLSAVGQVALVGPVTGGVDQTAQDTVGTLTASGQTITVSVVTSGTNTLMLAGVSMNISGNANATVSGITYNGIAMSFVGAHNNPGNTERVEIWSLVAPTAGTYNVVASFYVPGGGTVGAVVGATVFTGVDQNQPLRTFVSSDDGGTADANSQLDIPSGINEYAFDVTAAAGAATITPYTTGAGTVPDTEEWIDKSATGATGVSGSSFTHAGTTSIPMAEIFSAASNWASAGISVKPVQADVGVTVTSTSSTYPANLSYLVTVTNYGPTAATGVTLTDTLASGLTSVLVSSSQASCTGSYPSYACTIGNLDVGASAQITITATPSASGSYTNTASVAATQPADNNTSNNSAIVIANSIAISCTPPASLPAGGTLTGIINTYYPGSGTAAGTQPITVGALRSGGSATTITKGDLLLVIQMQGANINSANTSSYGNGGNGAGYTLLNSTGKFEYVNAAADFSSTTGGSLSISGAGPGGGLMFSYVTSAATATQGQFTFQVVRVPQYSSATLSSGLTAAAWNGSTGGILAVDVAGALTLGSATVSVSGLGFRGAAGLELQGLTTGPANQDYVYTSPTTYAGAAEAGAQASKGEGFAGTPRWVNSGATPYYLNSGTDYPDAVSGAANGGMARGAPGNAGGGGTDGDPNKASPGGNDQNSGGGGGGNGGAGGAGGDSWNSTLGVGGLGGSAFPAQINSVVMGGGGGGGTRNNSDGDNQASSGSAGGGIVMIRVGSLSGSGTITANGVDAYDLTSNDAGGGGGAGGSIIVLSSSGGESGLTISAHGGGGGDAWDTEAYSLANRHGPGGGGGGGVVLISGAAASANVSGGANGTTLATPVPYGATSGSPGIYVSNASVGQSSAAPGGVLCFPDLTITKSHSGAFLKGSSGSYSIVVSNVSSYGATSGVAASGLVTVTDTLPTGLTTPISASGSGWSCTAAQTVTCTRSDLLLAGASYPPITVTATVSGTAPSSVTNTATVSLPSGAEYNTVNNSASDVTNIVGAGSSADLAISTTGSSSVLAGNTITLVHTITNNGAAASDVTFTQATPANTTFQYVVAPSGWTCATPAVGASGTITCTYPSLALNGQASITVGLNTNPTTANGTQVTTIASVGATTTNDTNLANNTSSVATVVNTGVNVSVTNSGTPAAVVVGGKITYTQTVTNNGPSTAPNVTFTEQIPANTTFWSMGAFPAGWSCSTPAQGTTGTISCTVTSMAPGNAAIFTVVLNATATGTVSDVVQAWPAPTSLDTSPGDNSATATNLISTATQADLAVSVTGPSGSVVAGNNLSYSFVVTNNGAATVTAGANTSLTFLTSTPTGTTYVSVAPPTGWTCATANHPAVGGTGNISCTLNTGSGLAANVSTGAFVVVVKLPSSTASGTAVTDTGTITLTSTTLSDPISANNTVNTANSVATQADLSVTPTAPTSVAPSTAFSITESVSNLGPSDAATVTFTDTLPTNAAFVSMATPAGWTCPGPSGGVITCTRASIIAGSAATSFVINLTSGTSGAISNTAQATSSVTPDPVPGNNSATTITNVSVTGDADLSITNTPSVTQVNPGDPLVYTQVLTNLGPANAANNLTFTQSIPANTTFVSMVISGTTGGWTCPAPAGGVLTCTKTSRLNSAAATTFTLTVLVNSGTPYGTIITDSVSATSATTDPYSGNNTNITATTPVVNPNSTDVAVSMAAPSSVNQGDTLAYTMVVSNNGPNTANSVTLTDPLPAGVSFASVSSTAGSCSQASGTVTCTFSNMSSGSTATVTLLTATSSLTTFTNTATVSLANQTDSNPANNTDSAFTTVATPTQVSLQWFKAAYSGNSVVLQWKTGGEFHNLGFNVYREQNGGRVRLNQSLIAGAALRMRPTSPAHAAKTYGWLDSSPTPGGGVYWLEDVDLNGIRTMHGPAYVQAGSGAQFMASAKLITELRPATVSPAAALSARLSQRVLKLPTATSQQQQMQFALASSATAVKIEVQQEGWYRLTQSQLLAAGVNALDARFAHVYAEGVEQSIRTNISPVQGRLYGDLAVEFYGTGAADTSYSNTRVYWLTAGGTSGQRVSQMSGLGASGVQAQSFPYTVELQDRTIYFGALLTANGNNFFGAAVTTAPVDQVLTIANLAAAAPDPAQLEVALQGVVADAPHDVIVSVNGTTVGHVTFTGQAQGVQDFEVPLGMLVAGANTVTLTAQDGDNDVSLVDHITLTYPHTYTAASDFLKFTATAGEHIQVQGFTQNPSRLMDITDPVNPLEVLFQVIAQPAGVALDFVVPTSLSGTRTFLALADDAIAAPAAVVNNQPSNWHASQSGSEVVMITDPAFAAQLSPLVRLRQGQGRSVAVVLTDDIYDEFNFGERSPQAIRDFLQNASNVWQNKPQYVLLVGGASMDPNNYFGFGNLDFVPTKIIATSQLMTASDDWFSDFANQGIAQIATGRLPVDTADQAATVVAKIIGYETKASSGSWTNQVLLVADQDDADSFTQDALSIAGLLPAAAQVTQVLADPTDPATSRQQILNAINNGQLLVNYIGHGSEQTWSSSDLFDNDAAKSLTNYGHLPVFLAMDCLNGFFNDVYGASLAEALLLSPNGGAVAVWASSGLNNAPPQVQMNQQLIQTLVSTPTMSLGDAILQAKKNITDSDTRRTYILFGDPLMHLKSTFAARSAAIRH